MTEICRVCMKAEFFLNPIYAHHSNLKTILKKICPNIKVQHWVEGLPDGLCSDCEQRFRDAYDLVQLAEKSDKVLRKKLKAEPKDVKNVSAEQKDLIAYEAELEEVEIKVEEPVEETIEDTVTVKIEPVLKANEWSSDDDDVALSSFVENDPNDKSESIDDRNKRNDESNASDYKSDSGSNFSAASEVQDELRKKITKYKKTKKKDVKPKVERVKKELGSIPAKSPKAICPICGKTVARIATHLKVHQDTAFQCDICKKFLKAKANLHSHMRLVHMKVRIKCNHCDMLFWNTTTLRYHEQKVHLDSAEQYKCGLCEKVFGHPETLANHIKYHEYMQRKNGGKQIYFKNSMQCNACDFIYCSRPQYEAHINMHNSRFECKFCSEVFTQSYSVGVHRRYSHKNTFKQLTRMYFCDMCEFSTKSGFNLKRHRLWHQKKQ